MDNEMDNEINSLETEFVNCEKENEGKKEFVYLFFDDCYDSKCVVYKTFKGAFMHYINDRRNDILKIYTKFKNRNYTIKRKFKYTILEFSLDLEDCLSIKNEKLNYVINLLQSNKTELSYTDMFYLVEPFTFCICINKMAVNL